MYSVHRMYNDFMRSKYIKKRNASGKFPCSVCSLVSFLHTHHIQGREIPNANHWSNLVSVCPNCHDAIHRGEVVIEGWISTTDGKMLIWHKKGEESFTGNDATPHLFK